MSRRSRFTDSAANRVNRIKRLPHRFAQTLKNDALRLLYRNTAGLRVRFRTDSRRILLKCELPEVCSTADMALAGSSCFDLYADGSYVNVLLPGLDLDGYHAENRMGKHGYSSGYEFPDCRMREILTHFPLYNNVSAVYIGLDEGAQLLPASPYAHRKPVVYYGSSITQGGCASHPGNCYSAMLSRRPQRLFCGRAHDLPQHRQERLPRGCRAPE